MPRQGYEEVCPVEIAGELKCSCKKGCVTAACSCIKNNLKCSMLLLLVASVRGHLLRQRDQSGEREGGLGEGWAEAVPGEGASSGGG